MILVESDKCKIPKFSLINSSITPYIVIVALWRDTGSDTDTEEGRSESNGYQARAN